MKKINETENPNVFSLNLENINENNLTHSTPVSVSFDDTGEKENCNNWTSTYVYIIKTLFKKYPEKLLSLKHTNITNGKRIDFGSESDRKQMKASKEIIPSFYVETNFNAKDIVKKIKALLDICNEKYSNLIINYKPKDDKLVQSSPERTVNSDNNNIEQIKLIVTAIENAGGSAFYA